MDRPAQFPDYATAAYWKSKRQSRRLAKQLGLKPPSRLSALLNTSLYTVLPFLFFTNFIIAGTIVLSYTLYLGQPVPAQFIVGATIAFAGLVFVGIVVYVWIRCRGRSDGEVRKVDVENRLTGGPRRLDAVQKEIQVEPVQGVHAVEQAQPVRQDYRRRPDWMHQAGLRNVVEPPVEAYRGQAKTHQPRRASVELSAIQERSRESEGAHQGHQEAARWPYRSPSMASVPESLMPGRRSETPMPGTPARTHRGPVASPRPQFPMPLKFGPSIMGHDGLGEEHHGNGRRLQKAKGRNVE